MTQPPLPSGFTLRTGGGSTFLEIDVSHFDYEGVLNLANGIAQARGYHEKPRRTAWKGRRRPGIQHSGKHHDRRPRPPQSHGGGSQQ